MAVLGPHALWIAFFVVMVCFVGRNRIRDALSRVSRIEFRGLRVDLESGVETAAAARQIAIPLGVRRQVAERLISAQSRIARTRFLWIDDHPENNETELRILKALGANIDLAHDDDARKRLNATVYDIVLSDITRGGRKDAGMRFLPVVAKAILGPKVIFYTGDVRGKPEGAFGITTRPDELMHLIVDALERARA